jgi:5,10-methylenetetrahydromethanopterin reductase
MSRWAEALALHFDDSALGFYPGSGVLGSLQVRDVGQRIGDADVRSLTTLRVGGRRDSSQVQALAFTRSANIVHVPAGKASSGPSGSLLSRTAMAGPVVPTSTQAPPLSPPPGDHGVHRRAEDRPRPGGLRRDQERRPHPAGRTAAGIDRRRAADDGGIARLRPHRTRRLHRQPEVREQIRRSRDEFAIPPDAVARAIAFAVEQPYDVEIGDITIRPASKASQRRSRRLAGCGMRPGGSGLGPTAPELTASGRRQRMRIGIMAAETGGDHALVKLADQLRRAADDGFASAWMSNIFGLDALTSLAVAGSQVPGIELGTAVVPTYPRHPAVLAQQALTAALAAGPGRLVLGIGLSHKIVIEDMYGYSFDKPARHMREYLSVLVPLLDGNPVSVDGSTLSAHIGLSTPRAGRVPVLLAAMAPRMLELAGGQADGTVLWMTGPATVRDYVVPAITAAASAAGRPSPRVVCALPVCVTSDPDAARASVEKELAIYGQLPSYRAMLDREGAAGPGDVAIVGDEDAVAAQIQALADAGVTDFGAAEVGRGEDRERTRSLLKAVIAGR